MPAHQSIMFLAPSKETDFVFIVMIMMLMVYVCTSVHVCSLISVQDIWYMTLIHPSSLFICGFVIPVYILGQTETLLRHCGSINTLHHKGKPGIT